jgi:hypothetical protein
LESERQKQGYYNTGWFNPKMRSRAANLLICQQSNIHDNIQHPLKCFSYKLLFFANSL